MSRNTSPFIVAPLADGEWSSIRPYVYDTRAECEVELTETYALGLKAVWS